MLGLKVGFATTDVCVTKAPLLAVEVTIWVTTPGALMVVSPKLLVVVTK